MISETDDGPPVSAFRQGRRGARDRLQPALLDRLTDAAPHERAEAPPAQWIDERKLRAAVLRDLGWLFNCANLQDAIDGAAYPEAANSVINYGMRALAGMHMSGIDLAGLEAWVREAIVRFEPRFLPGSIDVRCVTDPRAMHHQNRLTLEIHATLWSVPYPLEILLLSDLDLESGVVSLRECGSVAHG
ncbi:type VI secretion system baseplate subunit TssE [Paraburkholderia sp. CNPSo 3157]|uniref:Type VI secretion system baseplate subunit TssE n=1 Tax=Paraburkholderia franconis TaxID=2654983 RepID=A0A7X1TJG5_9BURK|nr:type VI secretion system baseplate subunit TssE [Paraburkholderia franconis]MPW21299.1 type VI secretion system baseplate subunit TssE [Paraburkholderia franconis]